MFAAIIFIYKSCKSKRQFLIIFFVSSLICDKGNLVFSLHKPNNDAAYLTGPGLDSTNKASCNDDNFKLIYWALIIFDSCQAECISEHNFGATLAVTEIHPCPPCAKYAKAVPSSPDR